VYETYREEIVTIVDAHGIFCADPSHHTGNVLPSTTDEPHATQPQSSRG